ncbi:MAG: non-reducing end alpha-L-arabinofuranosidase family hydrolase [Phycisphaerae bacterium]|jgi:hypothetical protein|nr:non-reducing end alpha-L-arabinofuranosidase family hydrolase [Phycisphaerae bacterium]
MNAKISISVISSVSCILLLTGLSVSRDKQAETPFKSPAAWRYSKPLISPEKRDELPSRAQKDPTVVFFKGKWHVFMTVKLKGLSAIEYCSFEKWDKAHDSKRTILRLTDSKYYCAPQVFYFTPHKKWYLIYQLGRPGKRRMQVAFSTTTDIADPKSWTRAGSVFRNDADDPRTEGGLDYWMICDSKRAYLFITSLNGKMWRMSARIEDFPHGFGDLALALRGDIFEASHTYKLSGIDKYLTVIEAKAGSRRYYKAYLADRLDGKWTEASGGARKPFAGLPNIRPADGVEAWTDNISHGELIRKGHDQTLQVDPQKLRFIFQGALQKDKAGKSYGGIPWRIGMLAPVEQAADK